MRALTWVKGVDPAFIAKTRSEKNPYLSHAVVDAGILSEEQLGKVVERTFNIKYMPLMLEKANQFGVKLVQEKLCRKHNIVPVNWLKSFHIDFYILLSLAEFKAKMNEMC